MGPFATGELGSAGTATQIPSTDVCAVAAGLVASTAVLAATSAVVATVAALATWGVVSAWRGRPASASADF